MKKKWTRIIGTVTTLALIGITSVSFAVQQRRVIKPIIVDKPIVSMPFNPKMMCKC